MSKKFYITATIPYVNAPAHLGHALEYVQADALARYHRKLGEDVFFLTGTDENSLKNVQVAKEEGISTKALVDRNSQFFRNLGPTLNLSFNEFIRTTEKRHIKGAQKLWRACRGDIYKKKYRGLYCVGCEMFFKENELEDGFCPEHRTKPEIVEEENYFFRLSNYQKKLEKIIESDELKIVPQNRKNETLAFIKAGLEDFSISRSAKRGDGWGIEVPGDSTQRQYVWFDALTSYITALGYGSDNLGRYEKYWPADLHCLGKGVLRFHALYWPAMLLSVGLPLPQKLFVHGYLTIEGQKISKSLGNVIDPSELVGKYGTDAVRYYLLREISPTEDGDFTYQRFEERYNSDLANGLGNLVSRVLTLVEKYNNSLTKKSAISADLWGVSNSVRNFGLSPSYQYNHSKNLVKGLAVYYHKALEMGGIEPPDSWVTIQGPLQAIPKASLLYHKAIEEIKFQEALEVIWQLISACDEFIERNKPWRLLNKPQTTNSTQQLKEILLNLLIALKEIAVLLQPFMPETSEKILIQIKLNKKTEVLFPRL